MIRLNLIIQNIRRFELRKLVKRVPVQLVRQDIKVWPGVGAGLLFSHYGTAQVC